MTGKTDHSKKREDVNWQDHLGDLKETMHPSRPMHEAEWIEFRRNLNANPEKAAAFLKIPFPTFVEYLRKLRIHVTGVSKKLTIKEYASLIKALLPDFYLLNKIHFTELNIEISREKYKRSKLAERTVAKTKIKKTSPPILTTISPRSVGEKWIDVNLEDIIFDDFSIRVKDGTTSTDPYPFPDSRKSFKFLRRYLLSLKRPPLSVLSNGRKILALKNTDELRDIVTILKVKTEFIEQFQLGNPTNIKSILNLLETLPNTYFLEIAKNTAEEVTAIDYLITLQDIAFKPVPAFEIIPSANSISTEDTFIFTTRRADDLFLIWESTLAGRATYVFKTTTSNYEDVIQRIYDYIASYQHGKRMRLRKKDSPDADLNYCAYIIHSSFDHWREKLDQTIGISPI